MANHAGSLHLSGAAQRTQLDYSVPLEVHCPLPGNRGDMDHAHRSSNDPQGDGQSVEVGFSPLPSPPRVLGSDLNDSGQLCRSQDT